MDILIIVLRLTHILAGIFWAGGAVMSAAFLTPAVRATGPEGGKFMQQLIQKQGLSTYLSIAAWLTTLAGLALYWRESLGLQMVWILAPSGFTLTIGSVAGVLTAIMGATINAPTATRMSALAKEMQSAGGAPKPEQVAEMQKLQARLGQAGVWATILLVISAGAMAIARYV